METKRINYLTPTWQKHALAKSRELHTMSLALGSWLSLLAAISVVHMYNRSSKNSRVQIRAAKTLMQ